MKRILVLILGVLILAGVGSITTVVPANAQTYYTTLLDVLNYSKFKLDSLATLLSAPPAVSVSVSQMFSGITSKNFIDGSATNLRITHMTFPVTGGPCIDGAKAILITLGWSDYDHGGLTIQPIFASSAVDTGAYYSFADTASVSDTLGIGAKFNITPNVSGTYSFWLSSIPGAGYLFLRVYPWGTAHKNYITGLSATARMVY